MSDSTPLSSLTIRRPDDWHIHLRDLAALEFTVPAVSRYFGRAIVMPNLAPPILDCSAAEAYRARIIKQRPAGSTFEPLMTLYLTDNSDPNEIRKGFNSGLIKACKLYPAGATTNSDSGVTDIRHIHSVIEVMQELGMPLLIHGEVTTSDIDIFDREKVFIDRHLLPLRAKFPELRIVFEHITTADAAQFVSEQDSHIAATITAHHLLYERNHMLVGGIRPHLFCLPILKRREHQEALVRAATSGSSQFFIGSDSAPHALSAKESSCGCAGCYTGHATIELYAEAFDLAGALDQLEGFASLHGPAFYGLPAHEDHIELKRESWLVDDEIEYLGETLKPLRSGEHIHWRVHDATSPFSATA